MNDDYPPKPPDHDNPDSPYDWLLLAVATAFAIPFILANCAIILHRKKTYFRALGGVGLVVGTSASGIVWIAANFVTNQHFRREGLMKKCSLWSFWLQLPLGACLWLMLLHVRLHRLYTLCVKSENKQLRTCLFLALLLLPSVVFSLIATLHHASSLSKRPERESQACDIHHAWKYVTYVTLPPFYISLIFVLLFYLRRQTDFLLMSEHRRTCESTMMAFIIYLLDAVIFISEKQQNVAGRCFLTFCVCFLVFMDFWVRMGKPIYLCVFKSESEMKRFEDELRWCGAGFFNKVTFVEALRHTSSSISIRSSQLHDGDWILRTMNILFSEKAECEEQINLLEQRKSRLSVKIRELEEQSLAILA